MTLTGPLVTQPSVEQWNKMHASVHSQRLTHDDVASNAVISFLVAHSMMLDPEAGDNDPVLALQGVLEIGFLLGIKAVQDGDCAI